MGHQRKRPLLEPVLENYMGPPISYGRSAPSTSSAKVAPEPAASQAPVRRQSLNPVNIFGKLRDKYVKAMNDLSMSGDLASVAGYHGCVAEPEQHRMATAAHEKEIRKLREELAARNSIAVDAEDSDDEVDLGVGAHHQHH